MTDLELPEGWPLPYTVVADVDPSAMYSVFRSLPLFDDVFLNMQAMNTCTIDIFIMEGEAELLKELIRTERTPTDQAMFISAQSQMWLFATYELLRTWRQRARNLVKWSRNGALKTMQANLNVQHGDLGALLRERHLQWMREDESSVVQLELAIESTTESYELLSGLRVNLAKHEVEGRRNVPAAAPGYGRINMLCGALDFQITHQDGSYELINRRDIADSIRSIPIERAP